ncbi:MAG: single-stranded DNA-binding protein [Oscillospiraceae bacterium]|nr:single-stranded DNA-binding protein [Oscillospiraceae bacterium]
MNKVFLTGRLAGDVDYRTGNIAVARYTLAVDRPRKKGEDKAQADFIRCVAFGQRAEFAQKYLHKGTKILVEGRIQTGSYKDKDGKTVYTTDVVVDGVEFLEKKNSSNSTNTAAAPVQTAAPAAAPAELIYAAQQTAPQQEEEYGVPW